MTPPMMNKTGRPSAKEIEIVRESLAKGMPIEEIARRVGRSVESLQKSKLLWEGENRNINAAQKEFRARPEYEALLSEFTQEELLGFEYKYLEWLKQFKFEVTATEDSQIFLAIKHELLIAKCLKERKFAEEQIAELKEELDVAKRDDSMAKELKAIKIGQLRGDIHTYMTLINTKIKEFDQLTNRLGDLIVALKGTRDQRIKDIDAVKRTFLEVLKDIADDEFREVEGRQMELMRIAAQKEKKRLTSPHQYVDGLVDYPILTGENDD